MLFRCLEVADRFDDLHDIHRFPDALYRNPDDNPTIGIILCSQKNEAIVRYSVLSEAKQVFASKYQITLPTAEELQHEIEAERRRIEDDHGNGD